MSAAYAGRLTGQLCQCTICGHTFGGERGFERHRTGDYAQHGKANTRRCMTVAEMLAAGLSQDARSIWRRPQPGRFAAARAETGPSASSGAGDYHNGAHVQAHEVAA